MTGDVVPDRGPVAGPIAGAITPTAAREELDDAAAACEFPLIVWQLPDGIVNIVNPAAEQLVERPRRELIGHRVTEFLSPSGFVDTAMSALASGALSATLTKRELIGRPGGQLPIWIWTRGVHVTGDAMDAVSLVMPSDEVGRLGPDPGRPWRHIADVVVGQTDKSWRILRISTDVSRVLGARPRDLIGTSLRDLVHPEDVDGIGLYSGDDPRLPMRCRLRRPDGEWTEVGLLFATVVVEGGENVCFALIAHVPIEGNLDRVVELEGRLRRIADEVRAARVLDMVHVLPATHHLPLADLSSRQWEILSRLLRGQRVDTIARDLYVSPSTVRNHLSHIFRRFGVHSQRELLDLLRER
jgi:DNA-binding CsgD family transcriptional regulator/PAS domain-containing protein